MKTHHAIGIGAISVAIAAGTFILLTPRRVHDPALPERADLPAPARWALHARMRGHGEEMARLAGAVVRLDYDEAARLADAVRSDARLARPLSGDATELNTRLPPRFFTLQDELMARAGDLATAARAHDPDALADAYGNVTRTCVRCHATYLSR